MATGSVLARVCSAHLAGQMAAMGVYGQVDEPAADMESQIIQKQAMTLTH